LCPRTTQAKYRAMSVCRSLGGSPKNALYRESREPGFFLKYGKSASMTTANDINHVRHGISVLIVEALNTMPC
jgi:hypothetical protein